MTSEIRANTLKNRVGLGTVSYTNTGIVVSGIVTANSFSGPFTGDITGDGDLTLTSTDSGAAAAPTIRLQRDSSSPANQDVLGQVLFGGKDSNIADENYASVAGKIIQAGAGGEHGAIQITTRKASANVITANLTSTDYELLNGTNLSVDGNITGNGNFQLTSTDTGSSAAPELTLHRNSASPADADYLGQIKFAGKHDGGSTVNYAKITGKILDASNGTEDGIIEFAHIKAGTQTITGRWRSDSLQLLNGTSLTVAGTTTLSDDLNVDSGTLFVDVSSNRIGINQGVPSKALDVVGSGEFSSALTVGATLTVSGTCTLGQTVSINGTNPQLQFVDTNHDSDYSIYGSNGRFSVYDATNSAERFRINSTGKITHTYDGTAYDAQYGQFEIAKEGASNADPDWSYLSLHRRGQIGWQLGIDSNHFVIASTGGAAKNTLDAEKLRIESGGGLKFTGQGTSIPVGGILHHTNNNLYVRGGTNGLILGNQDNTNTIQIYNGYIKFETNDGSEKLRITSGGSVNIGGDYTQTSRKFKVTGNSTFDGGVVFTGTLEGSGFSVSGGNVIMPAFIAHDGDSNTKFGFAAADRFTVETAGNERLRIDENGK
ncbi:MAG: hypothetical protein VXY93_07615, partial [Pseudomonadota bacterium]|nr:hypothetical protein [Pseudomonadota bacterium]